MRDRLRQLIADPAGVTQRLHGGDVNRTRPEGCLDQKPHVGVGVAVVIQPSGRRGRRGEGLRAVCQREVAADFAGGIRRGLDDDAGLALRDDFQNVRRRQRAGGFNFPKVTAVSLRMRRGDVIDQCRWIGQIGISVNMVNVRIAGLGSRCAVTRFCQTEKVLPLEREQLGPCQVI